MIKREDTRMRFGCCTSLDNVEALAEAGYDYIELGVGASLMPESSDEEFERMRGRIASSPLKPEAFSGFLPKDLKVVGEGIDRDRLSRYVETATRRAAEIGGKVIVFGSSGSRNVPDGFPKERALDQIESLLHMAAEHAGKHGMTIAIEPICRRESNILNTVEEALAVARRVNRDPIRVLADLYHVGQEKEDFSHLMDAGDWLVHVHIAEPITRRYPGSSDYDFSGFFGALKEAGYDAGVSCECRWDDFGRDVAIALKTLQGICKGNPM